MDNDNKETLKRLKDLTFMDALPILAYQTKKNCVMIGKLQDGQIVFRTENNHSSSLDYKTLDQIKEELLK